MSQIWKRNSARCNSDQRLKPLKALSGRARRCRKFLPRFARWRPPAPRFCCLAKAAPERRLRRRRFTGEVCARTDPFIAINCNAIPETLLESELFGHEKGSFTGAHAQRKGLIESAEKGTLFLDEIGDLPLPIQVKLLRFLQEQTFMRVGGRQEIRSDVRIIAATNADLKSAIADGRFREDLYFRLAVVVIGLPPLRERGNDIAVVATEFLNRFAAQSGKTGVTFAPETLRAASRYSWPGNVRELQNRVHRAIIMADGQRITPADMELNHVPGGIPATTLKEARENIEREMVIQALRRSGGKISAASNELGNQPPNAV